MDPQCPRGENLREEHVTLLANIFAQNEIAFAAI